MNPAPRTLRRKRTGNRAPMAEASKGGGSGEPTEGSVAHQAEVEGAGAQGKEQEKDVYDFTHPKRGYAIIINNEHFQRSSGFYGRKGSEHDACALEEVFTELGFDVEPHSNLTAKKMEDVLKDVKRYDHSQSDCLAVAILSHGDQELLKETREEEPCNVKRDLIFGTDGKAVTTESIMKLFRNCPGLEGKPRLFFLQACRGNKFDDGVNIGVGREKDETDGDSTQPAPASDPETAAAANTTKSNVEEADACPQPADEGDEEEEEDDTTDACGKTFEIYPAPIFKDYLVMYATTPGHFAWRRSTSGTWFIQSLKTIFTKRYTPHMSLIQALTSVIRMVAHGYEAQSASAAFNRKKQTPVIQTMLVKDVYFSPKPK